MHLPRRARRWSCEVLEARCLLIGSVSVDPLEPSVFASALDADADHDSFQSAEWLGVITDTQLAQGSLGGSDRVDFFSFDLPQRAVVDVALYGMQNDLALGWFDAHGNLLAHSDGTGTVTEWSRQTLDSGRYYLLAWTLAEEVADYNIIVGVKPESIVVPTAGDAGGDTFGRATAVGTLTQRIEYRDTLGAADPADVFRVTLANTGTLQVTLDELTGAADLHVFDTAGQLVGRSRNDGTAAENIGLPLPRGDYFLLIHPITRQAFSYHLLIDANSSTPTGGDNSTNPPPDRNDAGDTFGRALDIGKLDSTWTRRETVGATDTTDVYKFQVGFRRTIAAELTRLSSDIDLYVFDTSFRVVGRQYRAGATDELLELVLDTGTYYALVIPHGPVQSPYELTLRPVVETVVTPPSSDLPIPLPDVINYGRSADWNLNAVNAPEAWAYGFTGKRVVVAVIDSGIDIQHPDLQRNIWQNTREVMDGVDNDQNGLIDDRYGWNFVEDNADVSDLTGHGTHVAGTVAALRNSVGSTGVAYDAQVMALRVLDGKGSGRISDVAQAIQYAVDQGARIICLSLLSDGYSASLENALLYAQQRNVLVVAASGNSGATSPSYPALHSRDLNNVLSVGAHDSANQLAAFSNRVGASGAIQVDAPGVVVNSTLPGGGYGDWSGTSMATPHVAGVAALILSANLQLSASQLRVAIYQMAGRAIRGSDARGGVDAAASVPLAVNAYTPSAVAAGIDTNVRMVVRDRAVVRQAMFGQPMPTRPSMEIVSSRDRMTTVGIAPSKPTRTAHIRMKLAMRPRDAAAHDIALTSLLEESRLELVARSIEVDTDRVSG